MSSIIFHLKSLTLVMLLFLNTTCNVEYNTIGYELLSSNELVSKNFSVPVYAIQEDIVDVQTDQLPFLQLGKLSHPLFGDSSAQIISQLSITPNPIFGFNDQTREDSDDLDEIRVIQENELISDVYLEIPFYVNNNDSDNDGVTDAFDLDPQNIESDSDGDGVFDYLETQNSTNPLSEDTDGDGINDLEDQDNTIKYEAENSVYRVDSIYGNKLSTFNLKVKELTYYLNSLDPSNNFESNINYFSSQDFYKEGFVGETLFDDYIKLNLSELRFNYEEDDSLTLDVDETQIIENRLSPRIRIPLDPSFFQKKILDMEGSRELANQTNFSDFLRGIIIKIENPSDNLYMILDYNNALIKVNYTFDAYNTNATESDTSDDFIYKEKSNLSIGTNGIRINNINNNSSISSLIENNTESTIYLKGGMGNRVKLKLFQNGSEPTNLLDSIRDNKWLINEANLIFYVDQESVSNWKSEEIADRVFLYNLEKNLVLSDYFSDLSTNNDLINRNKYIHGGILEYDENNIPYRYKIRVTEHIKELLISKEVENVDLGLVVTSDIQNYSFKKALVSGSFDEQYYPASAILNPMGTVIIGASPKIGNIEKKLQLEIYYTNFSSY